ncbi:MAG: DsbA family protein [Nanobdellota archaeon]
MRLEDWLATGISGVAIIGIIALSLLIPVDSKGMDEAVARLETRENSTSVTVTAYLDYNCPHCAEAFELLKQLIMDYPRIQVEIKQFPLTQDGFKKAVVAECARKDGRFFEISEKLFEGYPVGELDVQTSGCEAAVNAHIADGKERLVQGTPTFFINGVEMQGLKDYSIITQEVENAISAAENN